MAGETIFTCRGVTVGGAAVAGATHARISPSTVVKINQGSAGDPGPTGAHIVDRDLAVEVYGTNYQALLALLGEAAASVVISIVGAAGAAETLTVASVAFTDPTGGVDVPAKDSGGKLATSGVRGYVNFGAGDDFGDVITAA